MPVSLPPVSRREFLRRCVLTTAGLLAAPGLVAAGKRTDPDSWALFSDIHIAADRAKVQRGIAMAEHFEQATAEVLALPKRPAGVLISGDLALNSGEPGDYAFLRELFAPLRAAQLPMYLALGNHDHREHFLAAFPETTGKERPVEAHVVSVIPTPRANWFLLDSLEKTLATPGLLGESQLDWLAKALDAHRAKPAIVVLHHNLDAKNGAFALRDAPQFFEVVRPRRQVKACVFGHTHVWRTWVDESGIHCINLPPMAYVFNEGDPAGWVHARLERRGLSLELRCIDPKHRLQGQKLELKWRKA
jgi:3',5'-cyclic-AMP phosphodiesterase